MSVVQTSNESHVSCEKTERKHWREFVSQRIRDTEDQMSSKVFADNTLTIAIGPDDLTHVSIYAWQHKLRFVISFEIKANTSPEDNRAKGVVRLPPPTGDEETDLKIEEEARMLAGFKWLEIQRH